MDQPHPATRWETPAADRARSMAAAVLVHAASTCTPTGDTSAGQPSEQCGMAPALTGVQRTLLARLAYMSLPAVVLAVPGKELSSFHDVAALTTQPAQPLPLASAVVSECVASLHQKVKTTEADESRRAQAEEAEKAKARADAEAAAAAKARADAKKVPTQGAARRASSIPRRTSRTSSAPRGATTTPRRPVPPKPTTARSSVPTSCGRRSEGASTKLTAPQESSSAPADAAAAAPSATMTAPVEEDEGFSAPRPYPFSPTSYVVAADTSSHRLQVLSLASMQCSAGHLRGAQTMPYPPHRVLHVPRATATAGYVGGGSDGDGTSRITQPSSVAAAPSWNAQLIAAFDAERQAVRREFDAVVADIAEYQAALPSDRTTMKSTIARSARVEALSVTAACLASTAAAVLKRPISQPVLPGQVEPLQCQAVHDHGEALTSVAINPQHMTPHSITPAAAAHVRTLYNTQRSATVLYCTVVSDGQILATFAGDHAVFSIECRTVAGSMMPPTPVFGSPKERGKTQSLMSQPRGICCVWPEGAVPASVFTNAQQVAAHCTEVREDLNRVLDTMVADGGLYEQLPLADRERLRIPNEVSPSLCAAASTQPTPRYVIVSDGFNNRVLVLEPTNPAAPISGACPLRFVRSLGDNAAPAPRRSLSQRFPSTGFVQSSGMEHAALCGTGSPLEGYDDRHRRGPYGSTRPSIDATHGSPASERFTEVAAFHKARDTVLSKPTGVCVIGQSSTALSLTHPLLSDGSDGLPPTRRGSRSDDDRGIMHVAAVAVADLEHVSVFSTAGALLWRVGLGLLKGPSGVCWCEEAGVLVVSDTQCMVLCRAPRVPLLRPSDPR